LEIRQDFDKRKDKKDCRNIGGEKDTRVNCLKATTQMMKKGKDAKVIMNVRVASYLVLESCALSPKTFLSLEHLEIAEIRKQLEMKCVCNAMLCKHPCMHVRSYHCLISSYTPVWNVYVIYCSVGL